MEFDQNKNLKVKILESYIWYKSMQSFKLLWEKLSLSIYVTGVKVANYYPVILLACDRVSSGSGPLFLDDYSLFL